MARREPAAVRSRIQSPSLISQVTIDPASGLPWATEAMMASVSRKSTLSRRSRLHTRQARRAIGRPFHSISGMLIATTNGLLDSASPNDSVGRASGDWAEKMPGTSCLVGAMFEFLVSLWLAGIASAPEGERAASFLPTPVDTSFATSATVARRSSTRRARSSVSRQRSYSAIRQAQSKFRRADLTLGWARSQPTVASASDGLRHSSGTCSRTRPGM